MQPIFRPLYRASQSHPHALLKRVRLTPVLFRVLPFSHLYLFLSTMREASLDETSLSSLGPPGVFTNSFLAGYFDIGMPTSLFSGSPFTLKRLHDEYCANLSFVFHDQPSLRSSFRPVTVSLARYGVLLTYRFPSSGITDCPRLENFNECSAAKPK